MPRAPKLTGVLWMIMPAVTAAMPGNPRPTSSGTATAAGVPKPADASMNAPNSQAMMMTCTRRSGEMSVNPCRMVLMAPLSCRVFSSRMAPKMMYSSVSAMTSPLMVAATTWMPGTCQTARASTTATA